ncbi:MAG: hypothetical protein AAFX93_20195, partial [Verrucomicrobiota bacterium]
MESIEFTSQRGKSKLFGIPEHLSPSSPPRYYRKEAFDPAIEGGAPPLDGLFGTREYSFLNPHNDVTIYAYEATQVKGLRYVDLITGVETGSVQSRHIQGICFEDPGSSQSKSNWGQIGLSEYTIVDNTTKRFHNTEIDHEECHNLTYIPKQTVELKLLDEDTEEIALRYANERKAARGWGSDFGTVDGTENLAYAEPRTDRVVEGQSAQFIAKYNLCAGAYEARVEFYQQDRVAGVGSGPISTINQTYTFQVQEASLTEEYVVSEEIPLKSGKNTWLASIELRPISSCNVSGSPLAGSESADVGSVDFSISLGKIKDDRVAGSFFISTDIIDSTTYQPIGLGVSIAESDDLEFLKTDSGAPRQLVTPTLFWDIQAIDQDTYIISGYNIDSIEDISTIIIWNPDLGGPAKIYDTTGLVPLVTHEITNPGIVGESLGITTTRGSSTRSYEYTHDSANDTWTLDVGNGEYVKVVEITEDLINNTYTKRITEQSASAGLVTVSSVTEETYRTFMVNGVEVERMVSEVLNPDEVGGSARTTTYSYYDDAVNDGLAYGRLKQVVYPDGEWERCVYDVVTGRKSKSIYGYLNEPAPDLSTSSSSLEASNKVVSFAYSFLSNPDGEMTERTEAIQGTVVARSWQIDWPVGGSYYIGHKIYKRSDIQGVSPNASWDDSANLRTESALFYEGPWSGRIAWQIDPDSTATIYTYQNAQNSSFEVTVATGEPYSFSSPTAVVNGTWTSRKTNFQGSLVESETRYRNSAFLGELVVSNQMGADFDDFGRPQTYIYLNGTIESMTYSCCGLGTVTDVTGNTTVIERDGLGREEYVTEYSGSSYEMVTQYVYDASGRVLETWRGPDLQNLQLEQKNTYNLAGELINTQSRWKDSAPSSSLQTTYARTQDGAWTLDTTTTRDGSTRIVRQYADGMVYEITGTGTEHSRTTYGVEVDASLGYSVRTATDSLLKDGAPSTEYTKTYRDALGRVYRVDRPNASPGSGVTSLFRYFNDKGQLEKSVDYSGLATLYDYNSEGQQTTTAIDVNGNGIIDYDGSDRISKVTSTYLKRSLGLEGVIAVSFYKVEVWEVDGSDIATTVRNTQTAVDRLISWSTTYDQETITETDIDPVNRRVTTTTTAPDNSTLVSITEDGLLVEQSQSAGSTFLKRVTNQYDSFRRLWKSTDERNGTTTLLYYTDGQLKSAETPDPDLGATGIGLDAQTTSLDYDFLAGGLKTTVTLPDLKTQINETDARGRTVKSYGDRTNAVEYAYDYAGRLLSQTTWQDFDNATGSGVGGAAITAWTYNDAGLLDQKWYDAAIDSAGSVSGTAGPSYAYLGDGRLNVVTNARGDTVTYTYHSDTNQLHTMAYSDGTPTVTYEYDRLGRIEQVTDASGQRTLTYENGSLDSETYDTGSFAGMVIERTQDSLNRYQSVALIDDAVSQFSIDYAYQTDSSRLDTVSFKRPLADDQTFTYSYHANSYLVDQIVANNGTANMATVSKQWDLLNRLTSVTNSDHAAATISSFVYAYNDANQRTRETHSTGEYWDYAYDDLGQLTGAVKRTNTDVAVPGYSFVYGFDDIGNRQWAEQGSSAARVDYYASTDGQGATGANALNQYGSISESWVAQAYGGADPQAALYFEKSANPVVTSGAGASPQPARNGSFFYGEYDLTAEESATTGSLYEMRVRGTLSGGGAGGVDREADALLEQEMPVNPANQIYDADGNLQEDARWVYTWNAG